VTVQLYIVTGAVEDILATESWPVRAFLDLDCATDLCGDLTQAVEDARTPRATSPRDTPAITAGDSERVEQGRAFMTKNDTRGLACLERGDRPDYDVVQCKLDESDGKPEYATMEPTGKKAIQI